jgi:hypothetical protein
MFRTSKQLSPKWKERLWLIYGYIITAVVFLLLIPNRILDFFGALLIIGFVEMMYRVHERRVDRGRR